MNKEEILKLLEQWTEEDYRNKRKTKSKTLKEYFQGSINAFNVSIALIKRLDD